MEIAILMAAGLGTRMRPITNTTPKPLVKVHGTPMIETLIRGLQRRNIEEIYVVVGHLAEQFYYLEEKYIGLSIIQNAEYMKKNNISSLHAVADKLGKANCFICEADLYLKDASIFDVSLEKSCYFGKMIKGHSDDWVFETNHAKRITHIKKGGNNCYNMVGITYVKKEDARCLSNALIDAYNAPEHGDLFWDEIMDTLLPKIEINVHEIKGTELIEIDTVEELVIEDSTYMGKFT